ncbi:Beta-lactamase-like protein 2 [Balamuthia mandrillaris]
MHGLHGACPEYPVPVPIPNLESNPTINVALEDVDELLAKAAKKNNLPGLVAIVVYDQEVVWSKGYGENDPLHPSGTPPSVDSIFSIASITKVFTDLMLMKLRDEGIVSLDDPVTKYLPEFSVINPYHTNRPITLRQLASHTSGLARSIPCYHRGPCDEHYILERLAQEILLYPQYTRPHYSNLGLALLGRALEKAVPEKSYEEWVRKNILLPLGMNSTSFDPQSEGLASQMAVSVVKDKETNWKKASFYNEPWANPMGGLFSTAADMARLMSFFFRSNTTAGPTQPLDSASIAEQLDPVILTRDGETAFGLPFEFKHTSGYWLKSKSGKLSGYRSNMAIAEELKLGVFIAVNTDTAPDETPAIMDILLPAFTKVLQGLQPAYRLPPHWKRYLGQYGEWRVYEEEGKLLLKKGEDEKSKALLTYFPEAPQHSMRIRQLHPQACRWYDDGMNDEVATFAALYLMGGVHWRTEPSASSPSSSPDAKELPPAAILSSAAW